MIRFVESAYRQRLVNWSASDEQADFSIMTDCTDSMEVFDLERLVRGYEFKLLAHFVLRP